MVDGTTSRTNRTGRQHEKAENEKRWIIKMCNELMVRRTSEAKQDEMDGRRFASRSWPWRCAVQCASHLGRAEPLAPLESLPQLPHRPNEVPPARRNPGYRSLCKQHTVRFCWRISRQRKRLDTICVACCKRVLHFTVDLAQSKSTLHQQSLHRRDSVSGGNNGKPAVVIK